MKEAFDEFELSFSFNVWDKILYENNQDFLLDIYYNEKGYPANIHDLGGEAFINEYRLALINEICMKNNTDDIWRVSSDAFAIVSKKSNCGYFEMEFKGQVINILKKTIFIELHNAYTETKGE